MGTIAGVPSKSDLIKKAGGISVLPEVAIQAVRVVNSLNSSAEDLANVIEKDPAITLRVLKVTNSPFCGLSTQVLDVRRAVSILGQSLVQTLVLAMSIRVLHKRSGLLEQMMWDHSVGTAVTARGISQTRGFAGPVQDATFLAGLVHGVGKVIMNNETPDIYAEVCATAYNERRPLVSVEIERYGYDHTEVGASVLQEWEISPDISDIVSNQHQFQPSYSEMPNELTRNVTAIVDLSLHICQYLGIGFREPDTALQLETLASTEYLKLNSKQLEQAVQQAKTTFEQDRALFA